MSIPGHIQEIIQWGRELNRRGYTTGKNGNISALLLDRPAGGNHILKAGPQK